MWKLNPERNTSITAQKNDEIAKDISGIIEVFPLDVLFLITGAVWEVSRNETSLPLNVPDGLGINIYHLHIPFVQRSHRRHDQGDNGVDLLAGLIFGDFPPPVYSRH
jgi:hypothetical protein